MKLLYLSVSVFIWALFFCSCTDKAAERKQEALFYDEAQIGESGLEEYVDLSGDIAFESLANLEDDESTASLFRSQEVENTVDVTVLDRIQPLASVHANATPNTGSTVQPSNGTQKKKSSLNPVSKMKIIKNGRLALEVENAAAIAYEVEAKVNVLGGYLANSELKEGNTSIRNEMQLRIPNDEFDAFVELVSGLSQKVTYKKIWTQDVTEEFYDIQIRLKNKKEVEARYIDILRNKAKTVEEVLATEDKLRVLREEIESKEGRLRFLSNQVSFSTLYMVLVQYTEADVEESTEVSFLTKVASSLRNGWNAVLVILLFFLNLWPFLLILGLGWWIYKVKSAKAS